ncbi:MAG: hypothetical protein ABIA63_00355 [bacterium]
MSTDPLIRAAVDVGTNSILLVIAHISRQNEKIEILFEKEFIVRLGQSLQDKSVISSEAQSRAIQALLQVSEILKSRHVEDVRTVGTQVFRLAKNSKEVIQKIKEQTGISVQVLTGAQEAELSYKGLNLFYPHDQKRMLLDMGGGSTEIIIGNGACFEHSISLPLGALVLTEFCLKNVPPSGTDLNKARSAVLALFSEPVKRLNLSAVHKLYTVGGTATTLVSMLKKMEFYNTGDVEGSKISVKQISTAMEEFALLNSGQRRQAKGVHPNRAPIFLGGLIIFQCIMELFKAEECVVSNAGIRHGMILGYI